MNLSATLKLYLAAARQATRALRKNLLLLPLSAGAVAIFWFAMSMLGGTGMAGGLVLGILQVVLLTYYFSCLEEASGGGKIAIDDLREFNQPMFSAVINAGFLIWMATFLFQLLAQGSPTLAWVYMCLNLGIVIGLNALPEIVYFNKSDGMSSISEAWSFTRQYWIEWFIPLVALMIPIGLVGGIQGVVALLARSDALLPPFVIVRSALVLGREVPLVFALLGALIAGNWYMLFRGALYQELSSKGGRLLRRR